VRRRPVLTTLLAMFLLAGLGVGVTPADAASVGVTVAGGNGNGANADQLGNPMDVAVDASGNIYVADYSNDRIQRWAPGATTGVTVAGGHGNGPNADQFSYPRSVVLDSQGALYITDSFNARVQRWAPGATTGVTVAGGHGNGPNADQIDQASAATVDDDGNVYVADYLNHRVQRWSPGANVGVTVAGGNGAGGSADQVSFPRSVAVDRSGNLYVAEIGNNRVTRWAPGASSGVTVAGGNGAGSAANQLDWPMGLALDSAGNLFVNDSYNQRVQRWAPGATTGVTVAGGNGVGSAANQLQYPEGVTVDLSGNVYVADTGNFRVQRWDAGGPTTVLPGTASVTEGNAGTTTIDVPVALSTTSTEPVTVAWNTVFAPGAPAGQADPASDYVAASGTVTFAAGQTRAAVPVTINGDTAVEPDEYVAVSFHDPTNATVGGFLGLGFATIRADDNVLTPGSASADEGTTGTSVLRVPISLSNPPTQPVSVQWATTYAPAVPGDQANPSTDYLAASGTVTFAVGQSVSSVAVTVRADAVIEPPEYIQVSFHDPTGAVITGSGLGFGVIDDTPVAVGVTVAGGHGRGMAADQLDQPTSVAIDAAGNLYVADGPNARVQRWSPGATSGVTVAGGHGSGTAANQLLQPRGIALDRKGNLYISDGGTRVQRWARGATSGVTVAGGNGPGPEDNQFYGAAGIAVDRDGNVFIADSGNTRVMRWAPGATSGETVAGSVYPSSSLNIPTDVALDAAGRLYVADAGDQTIQRFDASTVRGVVVAGTQHENGSDASMLDHPTGLAIDGSGNLYIADTANSRVQRWAPGATAGVTVAGGNLVGSAAGQFRDPQDVTIDRSGNLFVADTGNDRVQRWASPVVVAGTASAPEGNSGSTTIDVPVTLSSPCTGAVTVEWNTLFVPGAPGGQADPATDYSPTSGTVTFAPGQTTATVSVTVKADTTVEPDEYVVVSFHDPTVARMGGFWGLGFAAIINDD